MSLFLCILFCAGGLRAAPITQEIPLGREQWHELAFRGIPANRVTYSAGGIKVDVDKSASPLVHRMEGEVTVTAFEVLLKFSGAILEIPNTGFEEDSYFRMGLVAIGSNKLGVVSGMFAPKWVKELFKLAPPGLGLDKIYFYNVAVLPGQVASERQNPSSIYIHERVVAAREQDTQLIRYTLKTPLKIAALWLSIDGDYTQSKFTTEIKNIKMEIQ